MDAKEATAEEMDQEWMDLILEAKKIGITLEEIRTFLVLTSTGTNAAVRNR